MIADEEVYDYSERELSFQIDENEKEQALTLEQVVQHAKSIKDFSAIDSYLN